MPSYTYKADVPSDACVSCRDGIVRWESIHADPMVTCPGCGRMVHRAIVPQTAPTLGAVDPRLSEDNLYMSQLAKYPGDPDAWVSGPHSWQRAIDKAQREGARVIPPSEDYGDASPQEIKRKERKESKHV